MTNKPKISISEAQLKIELIKLFESGNSAKTELLGIFRNKYKIGTDRFLREFDKAFIEWQNTKEKAIYEQIYTNQKEFLKSGLKSKLERQLELQAMLDMNYLTKEVVGIYQGEVIFTERPLTPSEIKNIHVELSKMDGSYVPTKIAETDVSGKDRKLPTGAKILYLGVDELEDNEVNG